MTGKKKTPYPIWVCDDCAKKAGAVVRRIIVATYHNGYCDVCKQPKRVTEPRDWGYPDFSKIKTNKRSKREGNSKHNNRNR
jgi:hypothetical protein